MENVAFAFALIGYILAGFAVSGLYDGLHDNGAGPFIGLVWPLYIAWLPGQAVYRTVKAQVAAQTERSKKMEEPSVPPGEFRVGQSDESDNAEKDRTEYKCERQKWAYKDYAAALFLDCMGYKTLCKMISGRVHASADGKDPFFLPFDLFLPLETHKCEWISDIIKDAEENRAKGMKWRDEIDQS